MKASSDVRCRLARGIANDCLSVGRRVTPCTAAHGCTARPHDNAAAATSPAAVTVKLLGITPNPARQNFPVAPANTTLTASATAGGTLQPVAFCHGNTLLKIANGITCV